MRNVELKKAKASGLKTAWNNTLGGWN
jgi:hypothetical protein